MAAALTPAACSSSFMALNDAVSDLQNGRTDYAMVGGSSALFRPATTVAFNQLQCARALRPCSLGGMRLPALGSAGSTLRRCCHVCSRSSRGVSTVGHAAGSATRLTRGV